MFAWRKKAALRLRYLERVPLGTPYPDIVERVSGVNYSSRSTTTIFPYRIDSSRLLPGAACCLMKSVTHPSGRDGRQIEEATECGDKA